MNTLRRRLFLELERAITDAWRPAASELTTAEERLASMTASLHQVPGRRRAEPIVPALAAYADSLELARAAAKAGAEIIYLEVPYPAPHGCGHGVRQADPGFLLGELTEMAVPCLDQNRRAVWKWPKITERLWLNGAFTALGELSDTGVGEVQLEGPGLAEAILDRLPGTVCSGGPGLNVFNHRTVTELCPPFSRLTLSPELSARDIGILASHNSSRKDHPGLEMIVEGNLEAVVTEDCVLTAATGSVPAKCAGKTGTFRGIRDEKGRIFPVRQDGSCRTHIQNAVETCLIDHLPRIASMGIGTIAIDLRGRTALYAETMIGLYSEALKRLSAGETEDIESLKARARGISLGGITAGHFLRGVQRNDNAKSY